MPAKFDTAFWNPATDPVTEPSPFGEMSAGTARMLAVANDTPKNEIDSKVNAIHACGATPASPTSELNAIPMTMLDLRAVFNV